MSTMPVQKPGKSEQTVGTPKEFIAACERRYGNLTIDLAATEENKKAPRCITPEQNSLTTDWSRLSDVGVYWLNPPYADIAPWAKKCAEYQGSATTILMLVPASIGSNWFANYVYKKAMVLALQGRLTFEGHKSPYPKDLILAVYPHRAGLADFEVWNWRK